MFSLWLLQPWFMTIVLTVGFCGLGIQFFSTKNWWPSAVGILSFVLYFYSNLLYGQPSNLPLFVFVFGLILLFAEIFVPSFGVLGILGFAGLIGGIVTAAAHPQVAAMSLVVAFVLTVFLMFFIVKKYRLQGIWSRYILNDEQKNEHGYTSASPKNHLLLRTGVSKTALRPSGVALIQNERVNVVTEGEFIASNRNIKVVKVEGTRVIVREVSEEAPKKAKYNVK